MPAFPVAAREALGNAQQRRNLRHATRSIRDKRLGVVGEVEDWKALRVAGAAIKDQALANLDRDLVQLEESLAGAKKRHLPSRKVPLLLVVTWPVSW